LGLVPDAESGCHLALILITEVLAASVDLLLGAAASAPSAAAGVRLLGVGLGVHDGSSEWHQSHAASLRAGLLHGVGVAAALILGGAVRGRVFLGLALLGGSGLGFLLSGLAHGAPLGRGDGAGRVSRGLGVASGCLFLVPHVARVVHVESAVSFFAFRSLVLNSGASGLVLACEHTLVEGHWRLLFIVDILFARGVTVAGLVDTLPRAYFVGITLWLV